MRRRSVVAVAVAVLAGATLLGVLALGWPAPATAFLSPGHGRANQRNTLRGRWKLTSSNYQYEWEIGADHVRIFTPNTSIVATEGEWQYLELNGEGQHVRLVRPSVDDVDYSAWIDEKG